MASEAAGRARGRDWSLKMCVVKAWGLFWTTSWEGEGGGAVERAFFGIEAAVVGLTGKTCTGGCQRGREGFRLIFFILF